MPVGAINVRLYGDVLKAAVAFIVIENILGARQTTRATHHRNAFPYTIGSLARRGRRRQIEIHIVGYDQVEPTVAIIVDKCAAGAPSFSRACDSGFFRHFRKNAALIVIQAVLAIVGDVDIFPAVVVVIPDADPLAPASCSQSGLRGHVGESSVVIVTIEMITRCWSGGGRSKPGSVY